MKKYWIVIIFLAAVGVRLAALSSWAEEKSLFYVSDSHTYVQVAKNLLAHGIYSMELSDTPHPDNYRTPLYPLFLLPFVAAGISYYVPVVVQTMLAGAGMVLIFLISRPMFPRPVALLSALAFAVEPFTALISAQLMTEPIFLMFFIPSILLLARFITTPQSRLLLGGSALLALSALTRPVAFYLFICIPLAAFLSRVPGWYKKALAGLGLFFLIISPWLIFITTQVKTLAYSSLSSFDIYAYHATYFDRWRAERGANADDRLPVIDLKIINETFDARPIPLIKSVGSAYLEKHWDEYAFYHVSRIPRLFTDSGYASIMNGLPFAGVQYDSSSGGFLDELTKTGFGALGRIRQQPFFLFLLVADLLFVLITLLALGNPLAHFKTTRTVPKDRLLLLFIVLIYSVLASPIGGARLRIPLNFLLFLLALDTVAALWAHRKTQRYAQPV